LLNELFNYLEDMCVELDNALVLDPEVVNKRSKRRYRSKGESSGVNLSKQGSKPVKLPRPNPNPP